jgi:hypothetical protein
VNKVSIASNALGTKMGRLMAMFSTGNFTLQQPIKGNYNLPFGK